MRWFALLLFVMLLHACAPLSAPEEFSATITPSALPILSPTLPPSATAIPATLSPTQTVIVLPTVTMTLAPTFACPGALIPRLKSGGFARALTYVNVRSTPDTDSDSLIGLIQMETTVNVLEGPVCSPDGSLAFWKVAYTEGFTGTLIGWIAEGQGGEYFVEPK